MTIISYPTTAADEVALRLQTHMKRALPHASTYKALVQRILPEYKPPYEDGVGWNTRFMPKPENQAFVPIPLVYYTVNVLSAVMGMRPPTISSEPKTSDPGDRRQAADIELLLKYEWMHQVMDEVHLDLTKNLSLKGRAAVKLGYGPGDTLWTESIDLVENLIADWSNDSYRKVNSWSYHSLIHPQEAKDTYGVDWPTSGKGELDAYAANFWAQDHANPLGRTNSTPGNIMPPFLGVPMVDFHYRDSKDRIMNALFVGGKLVDEKDTKLPDFPYIVVNCDVEPGNPFGIGDAEPVIGLQKEYATRLTAWAEAIRRNGQDQWVTYNLRGLTPKDLPGGGRYFPLGDKEQEGIEPLKFPIDNIGYHEYIMDILEEYRRITGIPPELIGGGAPARSSTSGYAMAIRFQSIVTRIGPRETRLKTFYRKWAEMTLRNMEIVTPKVKATIQGNYFTQVEFEPVTPRDQAQTVSTLATAVAAGITSRRTAMEDLHRVAEDEYTYIEEWNTNPALSPSTAGAFAQAEGMMQSIAQGNMGAAGAAQAGAAEGAFPGQAGENQHTAIGTAPPARASAAELLGPQVQPAMNPQTPPGLGM